MELLRDRRAEFEQAGVQPVGISRDSPWTHIAWTQALDLNFGLLSDFNGDATRALGIGFEFRGFHDVSQRSAFLVDGSGTIRGAWSYDTGELPDVDALLEAARGLKSSGDPA
jgi:peroxiredoxin